MCFFCRDSRYALHSPDFYDSDCIKPQCNVLRGDCSIVRLYNLKNVVNNVYTCCDFHSKNFINNK